MKIKKKFFLTCGLTVALASSAFANYPVIDVTAIATAVNQLYTAYDEVNGIITQVQQGYDQLQQAIKAAQNWRFDPSVLESPNDIQGVWQSLDVRSQIFGTLKQIDAFQNRIMDIERIFDDKQIRFLNGTGVTLTELMGFKHEAVMNGLETGKFDLATNLKEAWGKVLQAKDDDLKVYEKLFEPTRYMTDWEKALWKRKHPNQSPEQYILASAKANEVTAKLREAVAQTTAEAKAIRMEQNTLINNQVIKEVLENQDQTVPALLQKIALLLFNMENTLNGMDETLVSMNGNIAQAINDTMNANGKTIKTDANGNASIIDYEEIKTKYDLVNDHDEGNDF